MSPDLAILASPPALRNEGSGLLPLTAKAASFSGIGYARRNGVTLCMGQFQGGFALCTVEAGEFLDGNFQRIDPLVVRQATPAYLRVTDNAVTGATDELQVQAFDADNVELGTAVTVSVNRLGRSNVFLGPLTFYPDGDPLPSLRAALAGTSPSRSLPGGASTTTARKGAQVKARETPVVPYKLMVEFISPGDPNGPARSEQYTEVEDETRKFAEKTFVRVRVVDPHKENATVVKHGPPCALLREVPIDGAAAGPSQIPPTVFSGESLPETHPNDNNRAQGGDVLDSPGLAVTLIEGVSAPREGEPTFVRAVARRRQNSDGGILSEFGALIYAVACPTIGVVDPSDPPLYIGMWVDQVDYSAHGETTTRHPVVHGLNRSIDWLEKQAWYVLRNPLPSEATAFGSVDRISTEVTTSGTLAITGPADGIACPYLAQDIPSDQEQLRWIHLNPYSKGFRLGDGVEKNRNARSDEAYPDAGASQDWGIDFGEMLATVISHEARHVLQNRVAFTGGLANDPDHDKFVESLTFDGVSLSGSERLLDSRLSVIGGGLNPEFDLHGNAGVTAGLDCYSWKLAYERDALLNQRASGVRFQLASIEDFAVLDPAQRVTSPGASILFPTSDRNGRTAGVNALYSFMGSPGTATVTQGNCTVAGDASAMAEVTSVVRVGPGGFYFVYVTPPVGITSGTCVLQLIPLLATDNSGGPLTPGPSLNSTVPFGP